MTSPLTYRLRFRFWIQKRLNIQALKEPLSLGGKAASLQAGSKGVNISDSNWLVISVPGFASEDEARAFGHRLRAACEISSVMARVGINTGVDKATLAFGEAFRIQARESGTLLRDNIHGIDAFADHPNVMFLSMNANLDVHAQPQVFLGEMSGLFDSIQEPSPRVRNVILLLNQALSGTDPVVQTVFSIAAVEMLGQAFESWSDPQKKLLADLAASARNADTLDLAQREEVAIAIGRIHKLGLRQGVMRLLKELGRTDLRKRWDALYERRSTLVHGLAPTPGARYDDLAQEAMTICAQILLTDVAREIPSVLKDLNKYYPL